MASTMQRSTGQRPLGLAASMVLLLAVHVHGGIPALQTCAEYKAANPEAGDGEYRWATWECTVLAYALYVL